MELSKNSESSHGNANATNKLKYGKTDDELKAKNPNNTQLVDIESIPETPFNILKHDGKYYLAIGKYRLTEAVDTKEEIIENAKDASWWRIMQIVDIMVTENEKLKQLESKLNALIEHNNKILKEKVDTLIQKTNEKLTTN